MKNLPFRLLCHWIPDPLSRSSRDYNHNLDMFSGVEWSAVIANHYLAGFQHFPHVPRPLLRTVQYAQNFDALAFDSVRDNERRSTNDKFAGRWYSARPPHGRVVQQHVHLRFDFLILIDGGKKAVLGDVIELRISGHVG